MSNKPYHFKINEDHLFLIKKFKEQGKIDSVSSFIRESIRDKLRKIQEEKKT